MEKPANESDMTAAAQTDLRLFAADMWPRLNHKGRIRELCKLLAEWEWSDRRVRSVYNAEAGVSLRANEAAAIDALLQAEAEAERQRHEEEAVRDDIQALQARIARLEAALLAQDEEFHGPQMAGYRQGVDGRRGSDGAASRVAGDDE